MIKKVLVYPNAKRDVGYVYTRRVAEFFAARGVKVYATEDTARNLTEELSVRVIEESEKVLNLQKKRTQRKEAGVGHFGGKYSLSDARAVNRDM